MAPAQTKPDAGPGVVTIVVPLTAEADKPRAEVQMALQNVVAIVRKQPARIDEGLMESVISAARHTHVHVGLRRGA